MKPIEFRKKDSPRSINDEEFDFIKYIPFSVQKKFTFICELCFLKENCGNEEENYIKLMRNYLKHYINRLSMFLQTFKILSKKIYDRFNRKQFLKWKQQSENIGKASWTTCSTREANNYQGKVSQVKTDNELYQNKMQEYKNQINNLMKQIQANKQENKIAEENSGELEREKAAKIKLLAATLLLKQCHYALSKEENRRNAWRIWNHHVLCHKVSESAFTRVIDFNQMHTKKRYNAALKFIVFSVEKMRKQNKNMAMQAIKHVSMLKNS